jgi:glycogen synthase
MPGAVRHDLEHRARARAMSFDRAAVFDQLFPQETAAAGVR